MSITSVAAPDCRAAQRSASTAVRSAGYQILFATRHPKERGDVLEAAGRGVETASVAEALIRATGGMPVYEGGLENAREY